MNRRRRRAALTATSAAAFAVAAPCAMALAAAVPAQAATPDVVKHKCTTGTSSGNVSTCITWTDTNVWQSVASATVNTTPVTLKECLSSPLDNLCHGFVRVAKGGSLKASGPVHRNPIWPGQYCAVTDQQNVGQIGKVCITVSVTPGGVLSVTGTRQ